MLITLLENFFTHKDFLPPADQWPGTLFTPLHVIFAVAVAAVLALLCIFSPRRRKRLCKRLIWSCGSLL